jgi:hypothetical protein
VDPLRQDRERGARGEEAEMCSTAGRVLCAIALIVSLRATAWAQDAVEVQDGDRFSGELLGLEHGRLSLDTPSAGILAVKWADVVKLTSGHLLTVEVVSRDRYFGTISTNASGAIVVATSAGPSPPIPMNQIIRITPVGRMFRERWHGAIEFGLDYTNAEHARDYALAAEVGHRSRRYETLVAFDSALIARSDAPTISRNDLNVGVRRLLDRRWFALGDVKLQQDDPLELDHRVLLAGGAGRKLIQTNRTELSAEGGLSYNAERYQDAGSTDHSAEVFGGLTWHWFDVDALEADATSLGYVSLARGRFRLDLNGRVHRELAWKLYWVLDALERFDSAPPDGRPRTDFAFSAALGWTF